MTPKRLVTLVAHALHRAPTQIDLVVWGDALACRGTQPCPPTDCVHDDEADQALKQHIAASTYPATPADVRRIATGLANLRIERAQQAEREAAAAHAVPPTPEYQAAAELLRRRQAEQARELEGQTDEQTRAAHLAAARAAADAELARQQTATHHPKTGSVYTDQPAGSPS